MSRLDEIFGLRGRVAMVTGASSGLGSECARALAKGGADVGLVARREDRLEELAAAIRKLGVRACAAPADVTVESDIDAALARIESELGPVDVLLNGAGIAPLGRAERHPREKFERALETNLTSAFLVSKAVAGRMIERGSGGNIINLSSVMGSHGNPVFRTVGYAASKGGLTNLTRHLAIEWVRHGIRVNAIAPAYFPTEMTIDPKVGEVRADQVEVMERFTPLGRLGRPGELESAVLFLAAPASSYVTGSIVTVDGGWSAW
jgi:NAD(P)-dependent dehydrogenase (short-subunit alcohol dehydrogenase family)